MTLSHLRLRAGTRWRAAFVLAALIAIAATTTPRLHAQQRVPGYDDGIIAVVARDLPALTLVVLADSTGHILVPLIRIAEMVGMPAQQPDSARLVLPRTDDGTTTLDLLARTITGGGTTSQFTPAEVIAVDGEVYVTPERLAELLQATAALDLATLTLVLSRDPLFPAQQMLAIEQRRALLVARDRMTPALPRVDVPYIPVTGIGVLDWQLSSGSLDFTSLTQVRARAGAALWGGSFSIGGTALVGRNTNDQDVDHEITARYHRVFPDARYVTQLEAGDIISAGLFARFIRGVQITNAPQQRAYELGEVMLRPDLPAGWQYEVSQNGRLIGFSDGTSRDAVAVPLQTGASPVAVRVYGPAGQQFETTLLYQTPTTLLPRGRFEYAAAAGRCAGAVCDGFAQVDARFGKWSRANVGGGIELLDDSSGSALRPYAVTSFTTGTLMTGELQLMPNATYRGTFAFFPIESGTGTLSLGISDAAYGRVAALPDTRSRWDFDAGWDQRLDRPIGPFRSLRTGIGGSGLTNGTYGRMRYSVASTLRAGYAEMRLEKSDQATDLLSARMSQLLQSQTLQRFLPGITPLVDGGIGLSSLGIALIHAGAAVQHPRYGSIGTSMEWARGNHRPRLTLAWNRSFRDVQAMVRAVADPRGNASSSFSLRGAVSVSPSGSVTTGAIGREGYGGVYGTVFLDRDGNGILSDGDERVPATELLVGDRRARTDDNGRFEAMSLLPYTALRIRLDSTSAGDPGWMTPSNIFARPVPNTSIRVDVPLLETREVTGSLVASTGIPTVAGVTIELVPNDSTPGLPSDTIAATTFSDGQFYLSRVRPGRYRVRVAESSLTALGADATPPFLELVVPATGNAVLELAPIVLTRKP